MYECVAPQDDNRLKPGKHVALLLLYIVHGACHILSMKPVKRVVWCLCKPPSVHVLQCGSCDSWVHAECDGLDGTAFAALCADEHRVYVVRFEWSIAQHIACGKI